MISKVDEMLDKFLEETMSEISLVNLDLDGGEGGTKKLQALFQIRDDRRRVDADINAKLEELEIKRKQLEFEQEEAKRKVKESRRNFIKDIVLGLLGIVVPVLSFDVWTKRGLEFEKTGTIVSNVLRTTINKFKIFK